MKNLAIATCLGFSIMQFYEMPVLRPSGVIFFARPAPQIFNAPQDVVTDNWSNVHSNRDHARPIDYPDV